MTDTENRFNRRWHQFSVIVYLIPLGIAGTETYKLPVAGTHRLGSLLLSQTILHLLSILF
jgi:hypothetical protein